MTQTFKLVTAFEPITRRAFELADPEILKATNAEPLLGGEWLELDSAYKMARGAADPALVPSYCFFGEPGRTEMQALGKGTFLFLNQFEADTLIFDSTSLTLGCALEVGDVSYGGGTKRGLQLATSGVVVGYCTRLPATNNNYLRFHTA